MKVNGLTQMVRSMNLVREKADGSGRHQNPHHQQNQDSSKDSKNPEKFEITEDKIDEAIESFRSDSQAQANGLNASVSGSGPGLTVILKDNTGAVVRQFTGEEFIRLREVISKEGRARGKILDQKL